MLTSSQVAERLNIGKSTFHSLVADGEFPPGIKIGGSVRFEESTVDEYLAEKKAAGLWAAYAKALRAGTDIGPPAARLDLTGDDIELHEAVLKEYKRLEPIAAKLKKYEAEHAKAHEHPRHGLLGVHVDVAQQQDKTLAKIGEAKRAILETEALAATFPGLFGRPPC